VTVAHLPVMCPTVQAMATMWRPCTRDPAYEVSWDGRVRRIATGRVLKPQQAKSGRYLKVSLSRRWPKGPQLQVQLHQLVGEAWHTRPLTGLVLVVDHIDNDGLRCCATNLRWFTKSMNTRQWHAIQSRYEAAGRAYGWDREEVYPEQDWANDADRLAASGL
jgi:hypothetical protein